MAKSHAKKATQPPQTVLASARSVRQATGFQAARMHHAHEIAEDYVELIDDLIQERGEARSVDMAKRLGVSHVTVVKTIKRLREGGLVHNQPYRAIFLTPEGRALASNCRQRHKLVVRFLLALGVPPHVAEIDAEGIEHHVSAETLEAMRHFTRRHRREQD